MKRSWSLVVALAVLSGGAGLVLTGEEETTCGCGPGESVTTVIEPLEPSGPPRSTVPTTAVPGTPAATLDGAEKRRSG